MSPLFSWLRPTKKRTAWSGREVLLPNQPKTLGKMRLNLSASSKILSMVTPLSEPKSNNSNYKSKSKKEKHTHWWKRTKYFETAGKWWVELCSRWLKSKRNLLLLHSSVFYGSKEEKDWNLEPLTLTPLKQTPKSAARTATKIFCVTDAFSSPINGQHKETNVYTPKQRKSATIPSSSDSHSFIFAIEHYY